MRVANDLAGQIFELYQRFQFAVGAKTRVLIGTSDGLDTWSTVGVHENVIAASWRALEDAVKFGLLRHEAKAR